MANASVNKSCIGCSACTAIAPNVFEMADTGLAVSIIDCELSDAEEMIARQAALFCPVDAIVVE